MAKLLATVLLAACATTAPAPPPQGSRGPRADDHLVAAREHAQAADELAMWPDRQAASEDPGAIARWSRGWDSTREHRRLAAVHEGQAAQLQAAYDEACGTTLLGEVSVSPLQRYGIGGAPLPGGVRVFLSPYAGTPDELMAALQCHRAWMMLGRTMMDDCPLDLPGIQIDARGNAGGITLDITIEDRRLIPELQRRMARDLESARIHRDRAHE